MIKTKTELVEVETLEDVVCDFCKKSCNNGSNYEYMTIENYWGYGSKKDGELWEAQVCEACTDEIFKSVSFQKSNYMSCYPNISKRIVMKESIIIQK